MPQPPNFNKMMKQVQQMQADMAKAQEQLKDEVVEASAGGGMVTVKVTGDLEVKEIKIDPRRRSTPRTSSCSRTWCSRPSTRRCARPRSSPNRKLGGLTGGLGDLGGSRASRLLRTVTDVRAAGQQADHRAAQAARASGSAPPSGSPSTCCAPPSRTRSGWPTRSAR